jgi:hypothetical protein
MAEYSLQSFEKDDMVDDRVRAHTLYKSIHFYSKIIGNASHHLIMS